MVQGTQLAWANNMEELPELTSKSDPMMVSWDLRCMLNYSKGLVKFNGAAIIIMGRVALQTYVGGEGPVGRYADMGVRTPIHARGNLICKLPSLHK